MAEADQALVTRCLSGDGLAIREFLEQFQGLVFGVCYRMLGHREDAEDATQESLLRAVRSLEGWDPTRPLRPWLLAIAANRCRTALSKRTRRPTVVEHLAETVDDTREAAPARADLAEELQLGLNQLRDDYRTCFVMFYQQEMSCAEIAQALDCPEGTVKTWLHRARRELAAFLSRRDAFAESGYELHRI